MPRSAKKKLTSDWLEQLQEARKIADAGTVCSATELQQILGRSTQKTHALTKMEGFPVLDRGSGRRKAQYVVRDVLDFLIQQEKEHLVALDKRQEKIRKITSSLNVQRDDLEGLTLVEQRQVHDLYDKMAASEIAQGRYYLAEDANEFMANFMMKLADMFDDFSDHIDPNGQYPPEILERIEKQKLSFQGFVYSQLDDYLKHAKTGSWPSRD